MKSNYIYIFLFLALACNVERRVTSTTSIPIPFQKLDITLGESYESIRQKLPVQDLTYEDGVGYSNYNGEEFDFGNLTFENDNGQREKMSVNIHFRYNQQQELIHTSVYLGHPDLYFSDEKMYLETLALIDKEFLSFKERYNLPSNYHRIQDTTSLVSDQYLEILDVDDWVFSYKIGSRSIFD